MIFLKDMFQKEATKKLLVILSIIIFFYLTRSMINLELLTFLFTYLIYSLQNFIMNTLGKVIPIKKIFVTIILYTILFVGIAFLIYKYIPIMVDQIGSIVRQISEFHFDFNFGNNKISQYLVSMIKDIDIKSNLKAGSDYILELATNAGKVSVNIVVALILSFIFIIEVEEIKAFLSKFKTSKIKGSYKYIVYFGRNFLNSFGKVMRAQIIIAFINSILSVITLSIMGFNQLLGLGLMIFFLGLIPVAGVIISIIPLSIIAFKIGGIMKVLAVLIMVLILHALEGYVLNPKLMSVSTKLPAFFTFVILIVSEHYIGVWGLLLGIPLFMFILDLLNVKPGVEVPETTQKK